jgi:hypothetical protein
MAGPAGIPPAFLQSLPAPAGGGLPSSGSFTAVVQGRGADLWISLGGTKVPLQAESGLAPGQAVAVHVTTSEGRVHLRIQPAPLPAQPPPAAPASPGLASIAAGVLQTLGLNGAPDDAAAIAPAALAAKPQALRSLLSLLDGRTPPGRDLQALLNVVSSAASSGALPQALAADFAALAGALQARDSEGLLQVLRRHGSRAGRSLEARLGVQAGAGSLEELAQAVGQDLRAQVGRLLVEGELEAFLRGRGEWEGFREAAGRVMERLAGRDLMNLHGLEQPYVFLDVPFPPDAPIRHGQIHMWGRGRGKNAIDAARAEVVLDLETTRLGNLWISLSLGSGHCLCTLRADRAENAAVLEAAAGELAQALNGCGYAEARVRVAFWDGNRLRETAAFVRRMAGINLKA